MTFPFGGRTQQKRFGGKDARLQIQHRLNDHELQFDFATFGTRSFQP